MAKGEVGLLLLDGGGPDRERVGPSLLSQSYAIEVTIIALHNLLADIRQLKNEPANFEVRFGVRSSNFYQAVMAGDLGE